MNWSVLVKVEASELLRFSPYSITFQASLAIPTDAEKVEYAAFSNRSRDVPMPPEPSNVGLEPACVKECPVCEAPNCAKEL
jgi:hypothetical protein